MGMAEATSEVHARAALNDATPPASVTFKKETLLLGLWSCWLALQFPSNLSGIFASQPLAEVGDPLPVWMVAYPQFKILYSVV
jgi:hypothetical protein